ncbi:MAG: hypothetical protein ABI142_08060, partial [Bryocella sp.]
MNVLPAVMLAGLCCLPMQAQATSAARPSDSGATDSSASAQGMGANTTAPQLAAPVPMTQRSPADMSTTPAATTNAKQNADAADSTAAIQAANTKAVPA